MTIGRAPLQQGNIDMPRYFFDLDNGKANFVDTIGTDLVGPQSVRSDAIGFLAAVFKDQAHDDRDPAYLVRVRDEAGRVVFTTALSLQSNWQGAENRVGAATVRRPVVLIVEDEFLSRMSAAEMISEGGFDVVEVEDAEQAIEILHKRSDIQIVFTEIRLPGSMDGLKFAKYVGGKWPPIKIIATSAHFAVDQHDLPDGGLFLPKPYTSNRVINALRECIGTA
jgi:CheY-like chemotaxis protein